MLSTKKKKNENTILTKKKRNTQDLEPKSKF